jgi:redox-sensing transcriptional repressor
MATDQVSERTIGRLSVYRRLLGELACEKVTHVYSHQLANVAGVTAAQVRRDMMAVGCSGSPTRGYDVAELTESIGRFLDGSAPQSVALVGAGNLGRALLAFFANRRPRLRLVAAFDSDPAKAGRILHGCRVYPMDRLKEIVAAETVTSAILAVPAEQAQPVADQLVAAGLHGILNFAPASLRTPVSVYVEDVDITTSLETVVFFARRNAATQPRALK